MNTPSRFRTIRALVGAFLLLGALSSHAATLVQYAMSSTVSALERTQPTATATGLTASNISSTNLNTNILSVLTSVSATDFYTSWSRNAGFSGTTAAQAIADATYFTFTITPDPGQTINIGVISFYAFAATAGPSNRQFYILSDQQTPYQTSNVLYSASTNSALIPGTTIPYNTTTSDVKFEFDLSGNSNFQNITDSVSFRFYIQTPDPNQNIAFRTLTVEGTVIPEPSSLVLLGANLLFLSTFRRRRSHR